MDRKCITKANFLYKCQNRIGNFIIRIAKFIQCKSVVKMESQRQEDSNETICSAMDFLFEDAQRFPDMSFSELFPEYKADQEKDRKNIAEATSENDAAGNEAKEPPHTCRDFCWTCISACEEHEEPNQQDHICRDFCLPCKASHHLESIADLVRQYAFKRKPKIPKHIEAPKKPKRTTLADSVDEGDGPSFTSYIGGGQNVDHDDDAFWPYFTSAQKGKYSVDSVRSTEAVGQDKPKPRASQFAGITLCRPNKSNKSNQKIVKNIIELD
jgi:hypothetical protein